MMQNHLSSIFLKDNPTGSEMYSDISPDKMYFALEILQIKKLKFFLHFFLDRLKIEV